jgi:hypothetical protein
MPITGAAASLFNCSSMFTVIDLLFVIKHKEDIAHGGAFLCGSSGHMSSSVLL